MVQELFQWQNLETNLIRAFSPANPISTRSYFQGRNAYIRRVIDAVSENGKHVMIYGERGVGKTSLANVLTAFLQPFATEKIISHRVNCFRESTYTSIWNSLYRGIGLSESPSYEKINPSQVIDILSSRGKSILIIDEFDRIEDPDVDALFADTIKGLSDFEVDTTLVIVGVADDVDDLIHEHESIDRCLAQVQIPRMEFSELRSIVEYGMQTAGLTIEADAITQICTVSLGLPHYTHALGLNAGRAAIDRLSAHVESRDVEQAMSNLLKETHQTILSKFDAATASPRKQNYYFQVLLACALAATDHLGRFRAADVREPYSKIMKKAYTIPGFSKHLHDLCTDNRGSVLQRFGKLHEYRFRFTDPMMQPYVLMQGLKRGLVGLQEARSHNV